MRADVRSVLNTVPALTSRQWILLVTPFVLIASMYVVFNGLVARFGYSLGFSLGMIVYWMAWCIALPLGLLGSGEFVDLFREAKSRLGGRPRLTLLLLLWPLPFPFVFIFLPRIGDATVTIVLVSIAVGIAIGVTEEILWRGTYVRLFPTSLALAPLLMPADYSWIAHTTSESAAQGVDGAWLAQLGVLLFGLSVLWLAALSPLMWGRWAIVFHISFGVFMIGTAVFSAQPWDTGLPYDPIEDLLHSVTATAVGFSFAFGVLVIVLRRRRRRLRTRWLDLTAIAASVVLTMGMCAVTDIAGALQRAIFLVAYAWYAQETLLLTGREAGE